MSQSSGSRPDPGGQKRPVFRFAPSPNGELHLGHALSALLNEKLARESGGRLLLRIEDVDQARSTAAFEAAIYRDLAWLGIEWEEPVRRQSEHFAEYEAALKRLVAAGLAYPSFLTRGEVRGLIAERETREAPWPRDPDGAPLHPPDERRLTERERRRRMAQGEPFAWRLDMEQALAGATALFWEEEGAGPSGESGLVMADPGAWGDVVLARKETPTSYTLSVVVDDALQGITHVVRGRDLFPATSVQRLLQHLFDLPAPRYHHHRLVLGPDGRKLSKSRGDTGLRALREAGMMPGQIRAMLGFD